MRVPVSGLTFYRLVRTDPPTDIDFVPNGRLPGESLWRPTHPQADAWNDGISVWDSLDEARSLAGRLSASPKGNPFRFIARLDFPSSSPVVGEGPGKRGHWTLYGSVTEELSSAVTSSSEPV